MRCRFLPPILILCLSCLLHAQPEKPARHQLYGGYTWVSNTFNGLPGSRQPLNGWDASIAFAQWRGFRYKMDVSSYSGTNLGAAQNPLIVLAGVQYSRRAGRESVFGEALVGVAGINKDWGPGKIQGDGASFATLLGVGLDTPLTRHLAFRVSGGYQHTNFYLQSVGSLVPYRIPGLPNNFGRISSGMVWQF